MAPEGEEGVVSGGVRVRRLAAVIDSAEGLSNINTTTISTTYDNDNDDENDTTDAARRATSPMTHGEDNHPPAAPYGVPYKRPAVITSNDTVGPGVRSDYRTSPNDPARSRTAGSGAIASNPHSSPSCTGSSAYTANPLGSSTIYPQEKERNAVRSGPVSVGDSSASANSGFTIAAAADGHRSFCESIIASAVKSEGGMREFGPDSDAFTAFDALTAFDASTVPEAPQILMLSMLSLPLRHCSPSIPCHCGVVVRAT